MMHIQNLLFTYINTAFHHTAIAFFIREHQVVDVLLMHVEQFTCVQMLPLSLLDINNDHFV